MIDRTTYLEIILLDTGNVITSYDRHQLYYKLFYFAIIKLQMLTWQLLMLFSSELIFGIKTFIS